MSKADYDLGYSEGQRDAQARIQELEAQAAVLANAVRENYIIADEGYNDVWCAHCERTWPNDGKEQHTQYCPVTNLPQAVQRHLEQDKAIVAVMERIADLTAEDLNVYNINQTALDTKAWAIRALDAYRAAGGEE